MVYSNNDEVGLKRDLYERSKPGMIDTSAVSPIWFTFTDHEWEALQKDFFEKPLDGLLVDLVSIFRKGNPNYINLGSLFGIEKKRVDDKNKIIYTVNQVNRKENDITNVTMFLHPDSHIITEIYLHMQILPHMNELKCRIEENYSDLLVNVSNELVIIDRDYKLMLKE
ncbi:hypothetical protein BSK56_11190 [Paenibacillus borealis]|uniref:Uncharacterized protein n=1 Tax=Paenibacillus borealis TaxID=160799 RepID=A0ABX3HCX0_PAEBO|nr:hypothetical protein [Paenibacillus borealis]OMD48340.1 hypothetical protein BSK56_11190 [Paenibacillus borealis]